MAKKTVEQHVDHAIEKTGKVLKSSKARVHTQTKRLGDTRKLGIILGVIALLLIIILVISGGCDEQPTKEQAQSIAKMLAEEGVPIRGVAIDGCGYEVTYAAEDAANRFDDAILYDWAMIYGIAAAHDCEGVSIITTLDGEPLHEQSVPCEAVRAFARGVLTEEEFQLLVEHKELD